jgi:photosystem II stability/assembly factor-like uncharacterized protein
VRDDSEALIEEARRRARRRRRRGSVIAAVALAGAGIGLAQAGGGGSRSGRGGHSGSGSGGAASARARDAREAKQIARVATTDRVPEAQLFSNGTGWAMSLSLSGLYWTRDSGRSWRLIEPPVLRGGHYDLAAKVGNIAFRAPGRIWVTMGDLPGGQIHYGGDRYATIARTTDDGRTWRSGNAPGCEYRCGSQYVSFVSARRGYLLSSLDSLRGNRLDVTTDGGATWTPVGSAPFTGAIQFTTAADGWGITDPARWVDEGQTPVGGGEVYRTTNGGHAWQRVRLTPPRRYAGLPSTAGAGVFFGAQHGVIPVRYRNPTSGKQYLVVFTTTDGGRSWSAHSAPATAELRSDQWGVASGLAFTAPSARDWLFFAGRTLYSTSNSGSSWTTVHLSIPAVSPYSLSFTTPTAGWAIFSVSVGHYFYPPVLVRTTNGGRTWTALAPRTRG